MPGIGSRATSLEPLLPVVDPITGIPMADESADDLALELQSAGGRTLRRRTMSGRPRRSRTPWASTPANLPLPASVDRAAATRRRHQRSASAIASSPALASGAGLFIIVLVALVAAFLLWKAIPAIKDDHVNFFTSRIWSVGDAGESFGIAGLLWTTVLISVFAMVIAVPIAIGIALFITHYAPARLSKPVAYIIDLLAAIPSIIYGIWGIAILAPHLTGIQNGLADALGLDSALQEPQRRGGHRLRRWRGARDHDLADRHLDLA